MIPLQCPLLTLTNYSIWAVKLKAIFNVHGLWEVIEPTEGAVVDLKKDSAAIAYMFQAMPETLVMQMANLTSASQMWASLKARYIGAERVKKARLAILKNEFASLQMKEGESIDEFAAIGRLKAFEERTLLKHKQSSATVKEDNMLLTYADWHARKKESDSRRNWGKNDKISKNESRKKNDSDRPRGQKVGGRKKVDKSKVKCFKCDELGHYASDCHEKTKKEEANLSKANEHDEGPTLFMIQNENQKELVFLNEQKVNPSSLGGDELEWYLDNGASNHMTGNISVFSNLNKNVNGNVKFGDGSCVKIEGRGTIVLEGKENEQRLLTDV
ncbi:uncharacterized protein LOC143629802 [Bidens hawaiensis]|uniref:uncharacterized protein LOC143629802 n=1 Tax=Bidens hawaiensis TaxID=980011 RepID=UPI004048F447